MSANRAAHATYSTQAPPFRTSTLPNLQTTCSGTTAQTQQTEEFLLSLTLHAAGSEIAAHAHDRPYLCLLTQGDYSEKAHRTKSIREGAVLFRRAGYEHSNRFGDRQGACFNLEILSSEKLALVNQIRLPDHELERRGTTAIYRLWHSFRNGAPQDILNIQCHEALAGHLWQCAGEGDPAWVQKVQERICDDPGGTVSMQALAQEFQLHPNYMMRRFKQTTGLTLSGYLTNKRLEHSLEGLLWGKAPISTSTLRS